MEIVDFLFRWMHVLFGVVWVGMLYYFNFVQTEYFKQAEPEALADAKAKLAPRALGWFRWAAMLTLISGVILLVGVHHRSLMNDYIILGALLGILMFLNVWLVIWPNQKIVLGMVEGDAAVAAKKAALASRTNVLFSAPMLFCMLGSPHLGYVADYLLVAQGGGLGLIAALALTVLLQVNAIFGKLGPIASIRGVIHMSLALTAVFFLLLLFL
ncbi:Predicted membrane protein [Alteromonadaceae bacterium Bs31]|nr:Predicted membrane protein [Alteromonadaceae bacterium Bs31]